MSGIDDFAEFFKPTIPDKTPRDHNDASRLIEIPLCLNDL